MCDASVYLYVSAGACMYRYRISELIELPVEFSLSTRNVYLQYQYCIKLRYTAVQYNINSDMVHRERDR